MLNSASTLLTIDVIRQFKPGLSNSGLVRAGRWTTAGLLVVAVAWAPQLNLFPSLWQYLQGVLAYAVPPVVAVFLAGMFWRGANADGAAAAMIAGSVCGFILFLLNVVLGWAHIHFLYAAPILTLLDLAILVAVSARRPVAVSAEGDATMWKLDFRRAERLRLALIPFWQDYRVLAAALLALTAGVVIAFK
jgi:solute:Na+ symporter, SSS family